MKSLIIQALLFSASEAIQPGNMVSNQRGPRQYQLVALGSQDPNMELIVSDFENKKKEQTVPQPDDMTISALKKDAEKFAKEHPTQQPQRLVQKV
jgi:hypothetical protein